MARKSRKIQTAAPSAAVNVPLALRTAFYIRLSVEDAKGRGNSIDNQQLVLNDYIADRPEFRLIGTYIDNGLTGTNFNRPEFQRLLADIEAGAVDCVMVKDLSRLGRNFIDTSYYIEQYFFSHRIRFIAVTDQFDTASVSQGQASMMLPLKNMINEAYALDIGKKIRAQQHQAMLDGKYIGGRPPYGYLKDPKDCHHLIVDPDTAPVVRQIFSWAAEHVSINEIVRRLNMQGIQTASHKRREQGVITNDRQMGQGLWQTWSVIKILSSEVYMGDLVQGKSQTIEHRQQKAPPDHYIVVRGTHEPVVSRKLFATVQQVRQEAAEAAKGTRTKSFTPNIFQGKVFCAHCGRALHRQWAGRKNIPDRYSFHCLTNNRYQKGACPGIYMAERKLIGIVTNLLVKALDVELGKSILDMKAASAWEAEEKAMERMISSQKRELERNRFFLRGLFEHLVQKLVSQEEYQTMKDDYDAKVTSLTAEIESLMKQKAQFQERKARNADLTTDAEYLAEHHDLTSELIGRLIDRIEITHDHEVRIAFSFVDTITREGKQ